MFFRLKPTRSGQVLKLIESYRDDTARSRHRAVASLGDAQLARNDCAQIVVGMVFDQFGFEMAHKVFAGRPIGSARTANPKNARKVSTGIWTSNGKACRAIDP